MTQKNDYDDTKKLLNTIRKLNTLTPQAIREQLFPEKNVLGDEEDDVTQNWEPSDMDDETNRMKNDIQNYWKDNPQPEKSNQEEKKDFIVINNVEVVINSTDKDDLVLNDDEKTEISQMIDDYRKDVSEITEFGKLNIYHDSAKLDGNIKEINLSFTISAGDDNGVYLKNQSMIKLSDTSLGYIDKLKKFQIIFNDVMEKIIASRQQN